MNGPEIKPIRPEFLADTLSELAADDAMFFVDTGTARIWMARHVNGGRNRWLFGSFSWASMANAAANAFGAQLAYPGRQTIAMCGSNHPEQRISRFRKYRTTRSGDAPFGVKFKIPDFAKVAEAMGAKGIRIEEPGDVRAGLAEALAHKGAPVVVGAVADPFALSLPSHVPFHTATRFTLSVAKQVLSGKMDTVIKTIERNVGLI